jgi:2'-5' RNA ligase
MRAFLAFELPDDVRAELARAQEALRQALGEGPFGWTPPENWHLTLKFLGHVPDPGRVLSAVRPLCAAAAPISLRLAGLGTFGTRVIWAGLEAAGGDALTRLAGAIDRACVPLGFQGEDRPYAAHITLARVRDAGRGTRRAGGSALKKGARPPEVGPTVAAAPAPSPLAFTARELVLFESRLSPPRPAIYVPHARLPLGGTNPDVGGDTRQSSRADTP